MMKKVNGDQGKKKKIIIGVIFGLLLFFAFFSLLNLNRYFLLKQIEHQMDQVITDILGEKPLIIEENRAEDSKENYYLADRFGNGRASGLFQDALFLEKAFKMRDGEVTDWLFAGVSKKIMVKIKDLPNGDFYYAKDVTSEKAREKMVFYVFLASFLIAIFVFFLFRKKVLS